MKETKKHKSIEILCLAAAPLLAPLLFLLVIYNEISTPVVDRR